MKKSLTPEQVCILVSSLIKAEEQNPHAKTNLGYPLQSSLDKVNFLNSVFNYAYYCGFDHISAKKLFSLCEGREWYKLELYNEFHQALKK